MIKQVSRMRLGWQSKTHLQREQQRRTAIFQSAAVRASMFKHHHDTFHAIATLPPARGGWKGAAGMLPLHCLSHAWCSAEPCVNLGPGVTAGPVLALPLSVQRLHCWASRSNLCGCHVYDSAVCRVLVGRSLDSESCMHALLRLICASCVSAATGMQPAADDNMYNS